VVIPRLSRPLLAAQGPDEWGPASRGIEKWLHNRYVRAPPQKVRLRTRTTISTRITPGPRMIRTLLARITALGSSLDEMVYDAQPTRRCPFDELPRLSAWPVGPERSSSLDEPLREAT
jgi:hypothetical protein